MSERAPAVELRQVSKAFGPRKVLDQVSFRVEPGRSLCILGRSGTGKSVTLKHIVGLMRPDAGSVLIDGEDITRLSGRDLYRVRKRIGFLFQHAALFDSISVGENVAFPLRRHTRRPDAEIRARALELLASVGLGSEYDKMPADLSGGMRKRAGLARALALEPAILLADEPSAGLDPVTAGEIDELLAELKRGSSTSLVVVTHNIPSARAIGDELIFLHEGRILAQGAPRALEASDVALVRRFMASGGAG
ncbi:MAG: ATP-binding cassette domain-containing protein [Acidimicrobiia bacterium]|nr:ATP-binding cassette domain-containing protein [Acidimicrobiia bacterium]